MSGQYDTIITQATLKHIPQIDDRLFKSQIRQESQFNHLAVSPVGAAGLAQIMPATWKEWSVKAGYSGAQVTDAEANIFTGAYYMGYLYGQWSSPRPHIDRICLALASYNAGLGNILKAQKRCRMASDYKTIISELHNVTGDKNAHETRTYVKRILGYYAEEITG